MPIASPETIEEMLNLTFLRLCQILPKEILQKLDLKIVRFEFVPRVNGKKRENKSWFAK